MKLINDFFHIIHKDIHDNEIEITFRLNKKHVIFRSHFPGQPILPGVCQVAIVVETLENIEGRNLILTDAKNIKFLKIISPDEVTDVTAVFSRIKHNEDTITSSIVLKSGETMFSKFSLTCRYTNDATK